MRDFFLLAAFLIFSVSLGTYLYNEVSSCLSDSRMLLSFLALFRIRIHAHNHVIISLIIFANSYSFSLTVRPYVCHWHSLLCNMNGQQFVFLFLLLLLLLQTNIYIYTHTNSKKIHYWVYMKRQASARAACNRRHQLLMVERERTVKCRM
jgi:hypothetical protein